MSEKERFQNLLQRLFDHQMNIACEITERLCQLHRSGADFVTKSAVTSYLYNMIIDDIEKKGETFEEALGATVGYLKASLIDIHKSEVKNGNDEH